MSPFPFSRACVRLSSEKLRKAMTLNSCYGITSRANIWPCLPRSEKNGRRTGQGRTIKIEPTLAAWIVFLREKKGGELTGKVLSDNWKKNWESWRKKNWLDEDSKPIKWPKDCLRHSSGSYHLARGRSLAETSFEMENSPKILKKHYWNWETLGVEALAFWELFSNAILKDPKKRACKS